MISKKLVALLTLLAMLAGQISIAHAEDVGYVDLKAGDVAPVDGLLFDPPAMAKLLANQESKLSVLRIEKDAEISKLNLEIETLNKKKEIETKINKELYESLLKIKQDRIDQLSAEQRWDNLKLAGGFLFGFIASVTIYYAAVQVAK
jgi:hypothetical protein